MWLAGLSDINDNYPVANLSCAYCNITIPWIVNRLFSCPQCNAEYCSREHKKADSRFHRDRCRGSQTAGLSSGHLFPDTAQPLQINLMGGLGGTTGFTCQDVSGRSRPISGNNYYNLDELVASPMDICSPSSTHSASPPCEAPRYFDLQPSRCTENEESPVSRSSLKTYQTSPVAPSGTPSPDTSTRYNNSNEAPAILDLASCRATQTGQLGKATIKEVATYVVNNLHQHSHCILDNFNGAALADCIFKETKELYYEGAFTDGRISCVKSKEGATDRSVREDQVAWVSGQEHSAIQRHMIRMDKLMAQSNEYLHGVEISKSRTHAMVACYPGGGTGYKEHVDNPCKDGRCITTLYYVNPGWNAQKDGGVLTLFPNCSTRKPVNVEPYMDRLLLFWSDRRTPHKVNPVYKTRFAITLWYFDQEERENFIKRTTTNQEPYAKYQ